VQFFFLFVFVDIDIGVLRGGDMGDMMRMMMMTIEFVFLIRVRGVSWTSLYFCMDWIG